MENPLPHQASPGKSPGLRLGIIADPQYADLPPDAGMNRYYHKSLDKMRQAIELFNSRNLDLVILLGDLIDRGEQHFQPALDVLATCRHECLLLPGNHDFAIAPQLRQGVYARFAMPARYYSRSLQGIRLLVTDGCEVSTFATQPGSAQQEEARRQLVRLRAERALNAHDWNAAMSESQIEWLKRQLDEAGRAGEKALVLGHYPLHPFTDHCLWNGKEVASMLAAHPAALAHFSGHDHRGGYGQLGTMPFITFCGMVDGEAETAFAIATVTAQALTIEGFGRQPSLQLPQNGAPANFMTE
ncbi:metallophosphoesterase [Allorhizobium undicola]|uniref:metallophosphoesterase n=1 Tax=Allorhizobium undicola TaxID=78527 RepID=UPI0006858A44|nr:metallophosphoesterase [Allorhizobium undicola]